MFGRRPPAEYGGGERGYFHDSVPDPDDLGYNKLGAENKDFKGLLESKYLELKSEFDLEFALAQVLSPKQRDLFLKRLKGEKMTKTEREYFYRVVKKKVAALANSELHRLAQDMMRK